jgi:RND family efflux transporter MFP subunit
MRTIRRLLFTAFLLLLTGCEKEEMKQSPLPPPLSVETIEIVKQHIPIWLQYTGTTKASSEQEVRARVAGRLDAIYFTEGDIVKQGQKLFKIEQYQYLANLDAAKAKLQRDQASLRLAEADVKRYTPLVEEGLAPRATLDQYLARRDELKAQIIADRADIDKAQLNLDYTIVKAPVGGRISVRYVDVGNLVGQGENTLLTTIVQVDPIYAYFNPTESDLQKILKFRSKPKLDAYIEVRGSGEDVLKRQRLEGFVDFANNAVDPLTSTVTMRANISNPHHTTLPGTFVYVNIFLTDQMEFIAIPPQAVFEDQLGKYVYVADASNSVVRKSVETGFSNKFVQIISSGLEDGDRLIVSGLVKLREGISVNPTDVTADKGIAAVLQRSGLVPDKDQ